MYKTIIVKYSPKAKEMAARIEAAANQMEQEGFELISCSITPSFQGNSGFLDRQRLPTTRSL